MKENKFIHTVHQMSPSLRLLVAVTFAGIAFLLAKGRATSSIQFMVAWLSFALTNLVLFWTTMFTVQPDEIKSIAKKQDTSRTVLFLMVLSASFISLFIIVLLMKVLPAINESNESGYNVHLALAVASAVCSWGLIHTVFAVRYAHLYYTCKTNEDGIEKEHMGGLNFPNDETPDYVDFAYFSFVIGMTFQVSDVQVSSSTIRRLALLHGVLSFGFNTVIVALIINIISTFVQK
ncbi:protein of unknown function DUF1345 (plasmid) [Spirosoma linguale DSM 74]|uniref:DUF1345 domain-containing protein n=2 Tax=Spirosoma TaxID=107 RepID=D2QV74_SPILD|nr:protein of unknown function DUF1345 [Spirosoma linguale DSM 74]